jgi:hypothetical protein
MLEARKRVSKKQRATRSSLKALRKVGPSSRTTATAFPTRPNAMKMEETF